MNPERKNIRMELAYDGTDFSGWQVQKQGRTVQSEIERALKDINGKSIKIRAAGRTDAGVHAAGQVINFFSESTIPPEKYAYALNRYLPQDIRALRSGAAGDDFNARGSAELRIYRYYIYAAEIMLPHLQRYSWLRPANLCIENLKSMASVVKGTHDFSAFSAAGDSNKSRIRRIESSCFYIKEPFIVYQISGNAFLWKMVRSILGTIMYLAESGKNKDELKQILDSCRRENAGPTAPPQGLFLEKVVYNDESWD